MSLAHLNYLLLSLSIFTLSACGGKKEQEKPTVLLGPSASFLEGETLSLTVEAEGTEPLK